MLIEVEMDSLMLSNIFGICFAVFGSSYSLLCLSMITKYTVMGIIKPILKETKKYESKTNLDSLSPSLHSKIGTFQYDTSLGYILDNVHDLADFEYKFRIWAQCT